MSRVLIDLTEEWGRVGHERRFQQVDAELKQKSVSNGLVWLMLYWSLDDLSPDKTSQAKHQQTNCRYT